MRFALINSCSTLECEDLGFKFSVEDPFRTETHRKVQDAFQKDFQMLLYSDAVFRLPIPFRGYFKASKPNRTPGRTLTGTLEDPLYGTL